MRPEMYDNMKPVPRPEVQVLDREPVETSELAALIGAEINQQVATANRYPRSISKFRQQAMELATLDEATAESMYYVLPRGGKKIEGASIRLAEVLSYAWGNLRIDSRVVATDDKFVTVSSTAFDCERNVGFRSEVKKRITNKDGMKFNDDMIVVTTNAALSIAIRNAILKVIPKSFYSPVLDAAKRVVVGDLTSLTARRDKALRWFDGAGANNEMVLALLEKKTVEEIDLEDLAVLSGLRTALKDGEITLESAFAVIKKETAETKLTDKLKANLGKSKAAKSVEIKNSEANTAVVLNAVESVFPGASTTTFSDDDLPEGV